MSERLFTLWGLLLFACCFLPGSVWAEQGRQVVVYTSVDEVLSAEVFAWIEQQTGLDVLPVFDSEATKTTGLYLRLIQEASRPRADVFWNGEFSRTLLLKEKSVLESYSPHAAERIPERFKDPEGFWTGLSARARVLAFNPSRVEASKVPQSATALLGEEWKGRVIWANPMFGTAGTHCAALLAHRGEQPFTALMARWKKHFRTVRSNGEVALLVAEGAFPLGITDTDDVFRIKLEGGSIEAVPFDSEGEGTLLIPNTVAILAKCPHPEAAREFVEALLDPEVERRMAFSPSRQLPVREDVEVPEDLVAWRSIRALPVSLESVAKEADRAMRILKPMIQG